MLRFIAGRVGTLIVLLFFVSFATFFLVHLLPGNPVQTILGYGYTKAQQAQLTAQLGLDKPLFEQYFIWAWHALHGNLGFSYNSNRAVRTLIAKAIPIDGEIAIMSQVMALAAAIPCAIFAARRPNHFFDRVVNGTAFFLLALPAFVVLVVLQNVLAINLHVPDTSPASYQVGGDWVHNLLVLILPSFVVALGGFVIYFRVLRSDMITTFLEDYITLARSKGLTARRIIMRHAFRASSLSLVGVFAIVIGGVVGGVFIVEFLCDIPGLGYTFISAAYVPDYVLVQGCALVISAIVLTLLILADIVNHFIDPRVALE